MPGGQVVEQGLALGGELEQHQPAVGRRGFAAGQPRLGQAVDHLDGGVVGQEQLLGQLLHRHGGAGARLDRQHGLVLWGGDARLAADRLAARQEPAQRRPEPRQSLIPFRVQTHRRPRPQQRLF